MKIKLVRQVFKIIYVTPETSRELMKKAFKAGYMLHSLGDDEDAEDQEDNLIGLCESCLYPIMDGDHYREDSEGVRVCEECLKTPPAK